MAKQPRTVLRFAIQTNGPCFVAKAQRRNGPLRRATQLGRNRRTKYCEYTNSHPWGRREHLALLERLHEDAGGAVDHCGHVQPVTLRAEVVRQLHQAGGFVRQVGLLLQADLSQWRTELRIDAQRKKRREMRRGPSAPRNRLNIRPSKENSMHQCVTRRLPVECPAYFVSSARAPRTAP